MSTPFPVPHFVSPVGQTSDWRLVVVTDAAMQAGLGSMLPATAAEAAAGGGLDPVAVRVVLDVLAAGGLVEVGEDGRYAATAAWPDAGLAAQLHQHARSIRAWSAGLEDRLRGVGPASGPGGPIQQRLDLWLASMAVGAAERAAPLADTILARLPHAQRVLELGGGHGVYGAEFARRGLQVVMVDRPDVVAIAASRWLAGTGVQLVAGDFFETLPDGPFDVVLCFGITHTFSGEHNERLYKRVAPLLADGGLVAINTFLRGSHPAVASFAVQMLVVGRGGDTHRESDYRRWLSSAGLSNVEVIAAETGPSSLLVARRG